MSKRYDLVLEALEQSVDNSEGQMAELSPLELLDIAERAANITQNIVSASRFELRKRVTETRFDGRAIGWHSDSFFDLLDKAYDSVETSAYATKRCVERFRRHAVGLCNSEVPELHDPEDGEEIYKCDKCGAMRRDASDPTGIRCSRCQSRTSWIKRGATTE